MFKQNLTQMKQIFMWSVLTPKTAYIYQKFQFVTPRIYCANVRCVGCGSWSTLLDSIQIESLTSLYVRQDATNVDIFSLYFMDKTKLWSLRSSFSRSWNVMSLKNALDSVYTNLLEWLSLHSNFKLRFFRNGHTWGLFKENPGKTYFIQISATSFQQNVAL